MPKIRKDALHIFKQLQEQEEHEAEFFGKYNLSPEYQHVKASYRDTSRFVEERRADAKRRLEESMKRRILEKEKRLPTWGLATERPKKKKRLEHTQENELRMFDELIPICDMKHDKGKKKGKKVKAT